MNVKVSETRKTMGKDLLIFPETEEDSKKIYESMNREDSSLTGTTSVFRPPKNSAEAKVEDALSVVVKDVDTKIREEEIEAASLEKQGPIHKQSIRTWHPESEGHFREEGRDGGSHQQHRLFIGTLRSTGRRAGSCSATDARDSATPRTPAEQET